jgi:hypothetical protein
MAGSEQMLEKEIGHPGRDGEQNGQVAARPDHFPDALKAIDKIVIGSTPFIKAVIAASAKTQLAELAKLLFENGLELGLGVSRFIIPLLRRSRIVLFCASIRRSSSPFIC